MTVADQDPARVAAGSLRHRITIQAMVESRDDAGGVINTPTTWHECWANLEPIAGREFFAAGATRAEVDYRATLRYLAGVTPAMRVVTDAQTFDIVVVRNLGGRGILLELMLKERL